MWEFNNVQLLMMRHWLLGLGTRKMLSDEQADMLTKICVELKTRGVKLGDRV